MTGTKDNSISSSTTKLPDTAREAPGVPPSIDFVVSRLATGEVASRYGDLVWDWTPYNPRGRRSVFNFCFWGKGAPTKAELDLVNELHWVMYLAIWYRPGTLLSYQSLLHYLKLYRQIARYCAAEGIRIQDVLSSKDQLVEFTINEGSHSIKILASQLSLLAALGGEVVGFTVPGANVHTMLRREVSRYAESLKQHPPIPSRIYSHLIATLTKEISDFDAVADGYFAIIEACQANLFVGRSVGRQFVIAKAIGSKRPKEHGQFDALMDQHGLHDYFEAKELPHTIHALSNGLYQVQTAARLVIQLFTGMRSDEVSALPFNCLTTTKHRGQEHYIVSGTTTKLNRGQAKSARWITNSEGARAIRLAQTIGKFIARTMHQQPDDLSVIPLLISTVYLGLARPAKSRSRKNLLSAKFDLKKAARLRATLQLPIIENDLLELEQIDPHRAWRSEERFQVGHPWVLTSHQLRRSLALYAQRSGLVSLPSLRRQLQHITEEMSRYYARGSAFARDFIGKNKGHFGLEWQDAQPVSSALSYMLNVLLSDDVLFGGHGNWVDNRLRGEDGRVVVDRAATIQRFKRGEMAYKETPLGGCTNTDDCDQIALKWLDVDCVSGCKNLVGRLSKLERVVTSQIKLLGTLDPNSIEYRSEKADLDLLVATRDRVRQQTSREEPV